MREPGAGELVLENGHHRLRACRHGPMLYMAGDTYVGGSLDAYAEFSELEGAVFAQLLRPGMVALDVGANLGGHTVPMARLVGPGGLVVAYEPQRLVFQMLCANLALGALTNVVAHWAAATREPGTVRAPCPDYARGGNFGGLALSTEGEAVPGIPVDSLGLAACHLMKVDVEGMEEEVLLGAARTIARHRPVLYVENDREARSPALIERLFSLGYRAWWHLPPLYNPDNHAGRRENLFPGIVSINLLALPRERPAEIGGMREVLDPSEGWRG